LVFSFLVTVMKRCKNLRLSFEEALKLDPLKIEHLRPRTHIASYIF